MLGINEDTVGRAIYPSDLNRVLGIGFTSASQIANEIEVDMSESKKLIEELVREGELELWAAANCINCGFIWPMTPYRSINKKDKKVMCPMCNHVSMTSEILYYKVYKIVRSGPD